jgi:hypothetical protein
VHTICLPKHPRKFLLTAVSPDANVEIVGSWNNWAEGLKMEMRGKVGFEI